MPALSMWNSLNLGTCNPVFNMPIRPITGHGESCRSGHYKNVCHSCSLPQSCKITMFHHEFIVDNFTVWVNGDVSKLDVFASICPVPANQFMVSAFILTSLAWGHPLGQQGARQPAKASHWHSPGSAAPNRPFTIQLRQPTTPVSQCTSCHASAA